MKPLSNLSLLFGMLALAACSNNLDDEEDCLDPSYKVPLEVTVNVDDSFHEHCVIDTAFTRAGDIPYLRYYVAAYPSSPNLKTVIGSSVSNKVDLSIHPGKYTMVGWVAYEAGEGNRCVNFYTDDFEELNILISLI